MGISHDLTGQRVLVMGASSGLGRAISLGASAAGARVALCARRKDALEEAAAEAAGGAIAVRCDVTSEVDCAEAVAQTVEAFGGLDAVVYSSGTSPLRMLAEAGAEEWQLVMNTNMIGASLITAKALPHLLASRGRAVYLSSYVVRRCLEGLALYRVSKVALDALIEGWRVEHPQVHFTRIVLGTTESTEFGNGWDHEASEDVLRGWRERKELHAEVMPIASLTEAVLSVLAAQGYLDDIGIMPSPNDELAARELAAMKRQELAD